MVNIVECGLTAGGDCSEWEDIPLVHVSEACGRTEVLIPREAYDAGWDYPPFMGAFGIVSPRGCPNCDMTKTLWWALVAEHKAVSELTASQRETLVRIMGEPGSILPGDPDSSTQNLRRKGVLPSH